jgi:hypothetical protein
MEENPYVTTPTPKTVGSRYQEQNSLTIPCQRLSMKEAYRSSTLHAFGLRWPSMNPISKPTSKEKRGADLATPGQQRGPKPAIEENGSSAYLLSL